MCKPPCSYIAWTTVVFLLAAIPFVLFHFQWMGDADAIQPHFVSISVHQQQDRQLSLTSGQQAAAQSHLVSVEPQHVLENWNRRGRRGEGWCPRVVIRRH